MVEQLVGHRIAAWWAAVLCSGRGASAAVTAADGALVPRSKMAMAFVAAGWGSVLGCVRLCGWASICYKVSPVAVSMFMPSIVVGVIALRNVIGVVQVIQDCDVDRY